MTEETAKRIALALETLAGCTGGVDESGKRVHDGDSCPVHEPGD
jgi:hypothetical protein